MKQTILFLIASLVWVAGTAQVLPDEEAEADTIVAAKPEDYPIPGPPDCDTFTKYRWAGVYGHMGIWHFYGSAVLGHNWRFIVDFGDGTTDTVVPSLFSYYFHHPYAANGTYHTSVRVEAVTDPGDSIVCWKTFLDTVIVNVQPCYSTVSRTGIGPTYTFAAAAYTATVGVSYTWDFGDGTTDTGTIATHTYAYGGYYTPTLYTALPGAGGCTDTTSAYGLFSPGPLDCAATSTTFGATTVSWNPFLIRTGGVIEPISFPKHVVRRRLYYSDGYSDTTYFGYPLDHAVSALGTYTVTRIVDWIDTAGGLWNIVCVDTATDSITVGPPGFSCADYPVSFAYTETGLGFYFANGSFLPPATTSYTWSWDFGDGTPGETSQNTAHTYAASGPYTARLIGALKHTVSGLEYCRDTSWLMIWAGPDGFTCDSLTPSIVAVATDSEREYTFTNTTGGYPASANAETVWIFGDGGGAVGNPVTHTYGDTGTFTARAYIATYDGVSSALLCRDTVTTAVLVAADSSAGDLSLSSLQDAAAFRRYPNPASAIVSISFPTGWVGSADVQIYSTDGRMVRRAASSAQQKTVLLSVADLAAGVYTVRISGNGNTLWHGRLVVAK